MTALISFYNARMYQPESTRWPNVAKFTDLEINDDQYDIFSLRRRIEVLPNARTPDLDLVIYRA